MVLELVDRPFDNVAPLVALRVEPRWPAAFAATRQFVT
jgi:hypothetical protein